MRVKRLVLKSKRKPWTMQATPRIIVTGLKARMDATSFSRSSINLNNKYASNAGTRKVSRYTHADEIPRIASGKGCNMKTNPTHNPPAIKPNKAAHRTFFKGFKNKAKPVTVNKIIVPESKA